MAQDVSEFDYVRLCNHAHTQRFPRTGKYNPRKQFQNFSWKSTCVHFSRNTWHVTHYFLASSNLRVYERHKCSYSIYKQKAGEEGGREGEKERERKGGDYRLELWHHFNFSQSRSKSLPYLVLKLAKKFFWAPWQIIIHHNQFPRVQMSRSKDNACNILVIFTSKSELYMQV